MIDNIKSSDGAALVQAIDLAIASGDWSDATNVWNYIKSRRISLKPDLPEPDRTALLQFISTLRDRRIYLLSEGPLEAYLPDGYRSKDLSKLIEFVNRDTFWSDLPIEARRELETIGGLLMPGMAQEAAVKKQSPWWRRSPSGRKFQSNR